MRFALVLRALLAAGVSDGCSRFAVSFLLLPLSLHLFVLVYGYITLSHNHVHADESKCDVEWTSFQRCRLFGAQVLRQANGTVRDCAVQCCQLFGVSGFCSLDKLSR